MKKIVFYTVLIASSIFSISLNATEGIAVIDYRTVFLGTDLAREKAQTLYQDLQYANQKAQALEGELLQKLEAEQTPNVQKVINELVKAKKISLLFNSGALLAFDTSNEAINVTPEVINLLNQANKEK